MGVVLEERPDLAVPWLRPALRVWCQAYALSQPFALALDAGSPFKADGEVRAAYTSEWRAAARVLRECSQDLGLTPMAYARLMRERAEAAMSGFDLDAALAKGREVIDARALPTGGDGEAA
jgi:hypothetical protein